MVKPTLKIGTTIDGFRVEELLHKGGMATLWRVSHPDHAVPLLMKVPKMGEGADPAAIVSFEMEQMLLPRLSGSHVPKFVASGDFATQPHIVMEQIAGKTLLTRLGELPLPYPEVIAIGIKVAKALDDLHRQHVIHLDIKPSNIIIGPQGEAILLDFGLSHHEQLPDLMQEEFRLPYGTAPYMAPEQLRGIRNDVRSDIFSLGVLLYFFSTNVRPFGESETLRGMRRRLWRDPVPPRGLRPDYPPGLQEIVLRCLEGEPAWRYPTAAQLAFDLENLAEVKLTARSERHKRDPWTTVMRRRFNKDLTAPASRQSLSLKNAGAPIIAVALSFDEHSDALNDALRVAAMRALKMLPSARLACLNVLKLALISPDETLDKHGHNKHVDRMIALKHWAEPLKLAEHRLTVHVLEAIDPANAILDFASSNVIDQILIGARQHSLKRKLLGSVSAKVAAEADCTVTVVRTRETGAVKVAPEAVLA